MQQPVVRMQVLMLCQSNNMLRLFETWLFGLLASVVPAACMLLSFYSWAAHQAATSLCQSLDPPPPPPPLT